MVDVTWMSLGGVEGARRFEDPERAWAWVRRAGQRCAWMEMRDENGALLGVHYGPPTWEREEILIGGLDREK